MVFRWRASRAELRYNVALWQTFPFTLLWKYKTSVLKPKWARSWQGNTTANEIARVLSGSGLPLVNSVLRFERQFVALSMLSRSQSCAEEKERRNLFD